MDSITVRHARSDDRRQWQRVKLSVPVQLKRGAVGKGGVLSLYTGATADVSTAGAYVLTGPRGRFSADEILKVSLAVPSALRHGFPFARLMGLCRVARVERLSSADPERQRG